MPTDDHKGSISGLIRDKGFQPLEINQKKVVQATPAFNKHEHHEDIVDEELKLQEEAENQSRAQGEQKKSKHKPNSSRVQFEQLPQTDVKKDEQVEAEEENGEP